MIYSRFPLGTANLIDTTFSQPLTTVAVPGIGTVTLMAVHPCNPYCGGNRWASEHAMLAQIAAAHLEGPLIMAGDFNAVDDHGPMQALRRLGLKSATDVAGAGWLPTWPANRGIPPLIPIDHVMINAQLTAITVRTFAVDDTDHLGLIATLAESMSSSDPRPSSARRALLLAGLGDRFPFEREGPCRRAAPRHPNYG